MRDKITKRTVEAIAPSLRDTVLWDTEIPGFGCKITPKGTRIYILQYSQRDRDHRVTIGRHGVEFTAEQAKNEARRLRGVIASGENPALLRSRERSIPTVAELGARYLEEYARPHKKPSAFAQDLRNLRNHIMPLIGTLQASEIERQDIARLMRDIAVGKTAKDEKAKFQGRRIVRGGEIAANRVHALLSKMFQLAEDWKFRPAGSNPCRAAKRFAEHKIERYLSAEEFARLGSAFNAAKSGRTRRRSECKGAREAQTRRSKKDRASFRKSLCNSRDRAAAPDRMPAQRGFEPALVRHRLRTSLSAAARQQDRRKSGVPFRSRLADCAGYPTARRVSLPLSGKAGFGTAAFYSCALGTHLQSCPPQ